VIGGEGVVAGLEDEAGDIAATATNVENEQRRRGA
jgi:hypothetical protein